MKDPLSIQHNKCQFNTNSLLHTSETNVGRMGHHHSKQRTAEHSRWRMVNYSSTSPIKKRCATHSSKFILGGVLWNTAFLTIEFVKLRDYLNTTLTFILCVRVKYCRLVDISNSFKSQGWTYIEIIESDIECSILW